MSLIALTSLSAGISQCALVLTVQNRKKEQAAQSSEGEQTRTVEERGVSAAVRVLITEPIAVAGLSEAQHPSLLGRVNRPTIKFVAVVVVITIIVGSIYKSCFND